MYSPVAGFVLGSGKFIFPLFFLAGMIGLMRDACKRVAVKVVFVAVVCSAFAWWSFSSGC
ncbi:MAG: hypothetical protein ABIK28_01135 [Planctomycetota bacterium]